MISSINNEKIKYIKKLYNKKYREKEKKYVIEGIHFVEEAYKNNLLEEVYILDGYDINCDVKKTIVKSNILKTITGINSIKIIGIVKYNTNNKIVGNKILILDNIQDPGNLGTIIRSSKAFSIDTIILSNTVDLYNPKVLRSTQGLLFNINIINKNIKDAICEVREKNILIYGTDVKEGIDVRSINNKSYCLIMGNEGRGLSDDIKKLTDKNLYIKMNDSCESLNVGVACSILLYELNYKE